MLRKLLAAAVVGGLSVGTVPVMTGVANAQDSSAAPAPPSAPTPTEAGTAGGSKDSMSKDSMSKSSMSKKKMKMKKKKM